jgi:hypothetical protein
MKLSKPSITKVGLFSIRLFGILEIFIFFGIQFFWLIYKGDLLPTENSWELLALLAPFVIAYFIGVLCRIEKYRVFFRKIEWLLHLLLCSCYIALLILLQTRDEFSPFFPFTWMYYLWIITIGLVFISSIVSNLDQAPIADQLKDKNKLLIFIGVGAVLWLVALGIIAILRYPVYFWILSCIFHSLMIPISIYKQHDKNSDLRDSKSVLVYKSFKDMLFRKTDPSQITKKENFITIFARNFKFLFLIVLFFLAWNQWAFYHLAMGSIEDNWFLIVQIFLSPLFYAGFGLAILIAKFKIPLLGECLGLVIMALSITEIYVFAPMALGFALLALIILVDKMSSSSYASGIIAVQLFWVLGLVVFTYNGMMGELFTAIAFILQLNAEMNNSFINFFLFIIISIVFCFYLGFFLIEKLIIWRKKHKKEQKTIEKAKKILNKRQVVELPVRKNAIVLLAIVFGGLVSPFIILSFTSKGPPLIYPEKKQVELEDFCGTALAGFSNTSSEYNNLTQLGARWVRVHFSWRDIEKDYDNNWDFTRYDTLMDNATKYKIKVIAMLNYPPSWLNLTRKAYVPAQFLPHYLEYVNKTVRRYKDTVAAWEIWNEPNLARFWDGPMEDYYELFDQAVDLIHSIDPDLYILGSSLSAAATGWMPPYLDEMFNLGIMEHVDAISIHFYNFDPDTLYQGIKQYIVVGEKYGFTGDYLITEIGNPTSGVQPHRVSMEKLAENVIKKMVIASALEIKTQIWYCTKDSGDLSNKDHDPRNSERWFGLMYNNYTWKKAAYAFSLFSKFCSNSTYRPDLIQKLGGISSTDLMAALYQQDDGTSTLIMWYAPTIYEHGKVAVKVDIKEVVNTTYIHNIYDGTNRSLPSQIFDASLTYIIPVGDVPVFITFKAKNIEDFIVLNVQESIIAWALYLSIFGIFLISIISSVALHRRNKVR